jgi:hypothetical protein
MQGSDGQHAAFGREDGHVAGENGKDNDSNVPTPQMTPQRAVSPEIESLAVPPIQTAHGGHGEDNIYDATPRHSLPPSSPQEERQRQFNTLMEEPKAAGPSHEIVSSPRHQHVGQNIEGAHQQSPIAPSQSPSPPLPQEPQPAVISLRQNVIPTQPADPSHGSAAPPAPPQTSTPPAPAQHSTSAEIYEEAKRQQLLRDQDEKIPVNPTEPDMEAAAAAAAAAKAKSEQEELPAMSATSYPGQEWNPYGDGGEGWED